MKLYWGDDAIPSLGSRPRRRGVGLVLKEDSRSQAGTGRGDNDGGGTRPWMALKVRLRKEFVLDSGGQWQPGKKCEE